MERRFLAEVATFVTCGMILFLACGSRTRYAREIQSLYGIPNLQITNERLGETRTVGAYYYNFSACGDSGMESKATARTLKISSLVTANAGYALALAAPIAFGLIGMVAAIMLPSTPLRLAPEPDANSA